MWNNLRPGLLEDLEFTSAEDMAAFIEFDDAGHLAAALAGNVPPSDDLMSALLRHYIATPPMYFIESAGAA